MSVTEEMRKVFDARTVMAGVEPDFECVYMTKGVALLYLDEIDAENAKLRELLHRLLAEYRYLRVRPRKVYLQHEARMRAIEKEMRELGVVE